MFIKESYDKYELASDFSPTDLIPRNSKGTEYIYFMHDSCFHSFESATSRIKIVFIRFQKFSRKTYLIQLRNLICQHKFATIWWVKIKKNFA